MNHVFVADLAGVHDGSELLVDGDEGHHAVRVRRIRVGESVEVVDGAGTRVIGEVAQVFKDSCTVSVREVAHEPAASPQLTVIQALVKKDRSDQAIELLTEAGVDVVVPWAAARSQMPTLPAKWERIARESSKQARRARFPEIRNVHTTESVAQLIESVTRDGGLALVCHESATSPLVQVLANAGAGVQHVVIVIGPEGGLTDEETSRFTSAGAQAVVMGPAVMRAATAGAVAASIVSAVTPRWKGNV